MHIGIGLEKIKIKGGEHSNFNSQVRNGIFFFVLRNIEVESV